MIESSGFIIKRDEKIVCESKWSIILLLVTWIPVPFILILTFALTKGVVPDILFVLIGVASILLSIGWLVWSAILTKKNFGHSLTVTDKRVLGKVGEERLESSLNKIVNVYVEQSLWGKLLHYGSLVLQTENKSLTFRNIHNPHHLHKLLMPFASNYCAR